MISRRSTLAWSGDGIVVAALDSGISRKRRSFPLSASSRAILSRFVASPSQMFNFRPAASSEHVRSSTASSARDRPNAAQRNAFRIPGRARVKHSSCLPSLSGFQRQEPPPVLEQSPTQPLLHHRSLLDAPDTPELKPSHRA